MAGKLLIAGLAGLASARTTWRDLSDGSEYGFEQWQAEHGTDYLPAHKEVFEANLAQIRAHNADASQSWKAGVNKFTGMTKAEVKAFIGRGYSNAGPAMAAARTGAKMHDGSRDVDVSALPSSLDWRTVSPSVVTAVKDQASCGGCWTFSAAETMESHIAIRTGKLFTFSEQELIDCTPNPNHCGGDGGCSGATQELAFGYAMGPGITTEQSYPYTARTGKCDTTKIKPVANITGYVFLPPNNYSALMNAVVNVGPQAISAAAEPWSSYETGVFKSNCGSDVDHAIVLEGYGTDPTYGDYYLVRNSWGTGWGEKGYIRIARFGDTPAGEPCVTDNTPGDGDGCQGGPPSIQVCGLCGILSDTSYPTGGSLV